MTRLGAAARACLGAACAAAIGFACGRAATHTAATAAAPTERATDGLIARLAHDASGYLGATYGGLAYGAVIYGGGPDARLAAGRATMYGDFELPEEDVRQWRPPVRPYQLDYEVREGAAAGAISGTVRWQNPPARTARGCDPTPIIGARGQLADAVVFLEDIRAGRQMLRGLTSGSSSFRRLQIGGTIIARDCGAVPRVQLIAPLGATLRVSRGNKGPAEMVATAADRAGTSPLFRLALPGGGAEREVALDLPGIYAMRAADAPALGWIVVQGHPYFAITDTDGAFRLDAVPPGTYRLRVWVPPLDPTSADSSRSQPRVLSRTITVRQGAVARVALSL
ncbi:MAG TPA: hypothetical protein VML75_21160 [Kofleriaceae bacterium]|nr:hypothetical protein [Kofleriaceae bacterium]